jgi:hypothetical protein
VTEGERIRIVLHNELPEPTSLHLHGLELSNAMDGVRFVVQDPIKPGDSFAYELTLHQNGTYFYHAADGVRPVAPRRKPYPFHPYPQRMRLGGGRFGLIFRQALSIITGGRSKFPRVDSCQTSL